MQTPTSGVPRRQRLVLLAAPGELPGAARDLHGQATRHRADGVQRRRYAVPRPRRDRRAVMWRAVHRGGVDGPVVRGGL